MIETPDRRQTMLVEGRRLFLSGGYTATSVDAICGAAGVTKGAFFHHFRSKDDFAAHVLAFTWQPVADAHESPQEDVGTLARLVEYIGFMAEWIYEAGRLLPVIAQELGTSNPEIRSQVRGYFAAWMSRLEDLLQAAAVETGSRVDIEALKEFIVATTEGIPVVINQFGPQALVNVTDRLVAAVSDAIRS